MAGIIAGMDLTPQILDDADLTAAWVEGSQRILHDEHRDAAERADAGCALLHLATIGEHDGHRGSIPATLPDQLHETWHLAFSDADGVDRLAAVTTLYQHVTQALLAEEGDQILRRELGA